MKNINLNFNIAINSLKKSNNNINYFISFLTYLGKTKQRIRLGKKIDNKVKRVGRKKKEKEVDENMFVGKNNNLEDITYKEIDGKIGLREPIYCFCNYVSYGDMVKCDNPNVI